ncbi:uncharacterized protein VTP21DRAFT_590 [Calcarisporiella thermophila]|uniref:uncharacterized protein n=1 Tax=Calcarisporiella thermophila TaxID=911321 RepID=UPI003744270B
MVVGEPPDPAENYESIVKKRKIENPEESIHTSSDIEMAANVRFLVKRLSDKARIPTRGSSLSAGYDLYSAKDIVIPARNRALIPTDLSVALPPNTYGRVAPRSGMALKNFLDTGAGVVDADYRGPLGIVMFNHAEEDFQVKEGDRIAQLIIERIFTPEVEEVEDLEQTIRGAGGFGSTGRN